MQDISITIEGVPLDYDLARNLAQLTALRLNSEAVLISWNDGARDIHSPSGLKCVINNESGWEVYGRNHGGEFRISLNEDAFVFIYGAMAVEIT